MAYNSRLLPRDTGPGKSSSIQTYPCGNTVGAVVSTAHAFRLADFTADRDSHPALKLCGRKYTILPVNKQGLSAKCAFPPLPGSPLPGSVRRDRLSRDWYAGIASVGIASAGIAPAGIASDGIASDGIASAGIASGVVVSGSPCLKDCPATLPNLIGHNKG